MERFSKLSHFHSTGGSLALGLLAGCSTGAVDGGSKALTAECAPVAEMPVGAWQCSEDLTIECGTADTTLYLSEETYACADQPLELSDSGPFGVGTHTVRVSGPGGELCNSQLTVVDEAPPVLEPQTIYLWPPNHKLHEVAVSDCVRAVDACDGELSGTFVWASSDEPIDDIGDGHFGPDIGLGRDAQHACVRAERQGPKDGRVYRLGVRVADAAGNVAESECLVVVDHDQRGVAGLDSGDAYRVDFDDSEPGLDCAGAEAQPDAGSPPLPGDAGDEAMPDPPEVDAGEVVDAGSSEPII